MLLPNTNVRLWLYRQPTDIRKSFDALAALVRHALDEDPLSGALFTFVNRRRTMMKVLCFEGDGYSIWSKRLGRGCIARGIAKANRRSAASPCVAVEDVGDG